jgi:hypothetical protein
LQPFGQPFELLVCAELVQAVNADLNRLGVVVGDTVPVAGLIRLGKMLKFAIAVCHSRGWRHYSVLIAGRFRSGCLPAVSTPSRDLAGKSPPLLARLNRS